MLLRERHSALVVVDVQEKLVAAIPPAASGRMIRHCAILLEAADALGVPVFVTRQYPQGLGDTAAALRAKMPATAGQFDKTCFSSCGAQGFVDAIAATGRRSIVVAGIEAHVCVLQTAFELKALGYDVFVPTDATASRADDNRLNAMDRLRRHGVEITNTESALFEWLRDAAHERFRQLSKLIR
jgi:nicotinamidase-related amidase